MLFLLKIALPPILVAVMSLAARRWGPTFGGLVMGLPWMTGPVLFFLGLDKGEEFAVAACAGIELGVLCICAFMLAYAAMSCWRPGRSAWRRRRRRSRRRLAGAGTDDCAAAGGAGCGWRRLP